MKISTFLTFLFFSFSTISVFAQQQSIEVERSFGILKPEEGVHSFGTYEDRLFIVPYDVDEVTVYGGDRQNGWAFFDQIFNYDSKLKTYIEDQNPPVSERIWTGSGIIQRGYTEFSPNGQVFINTIGGKTEYTAVTFHVASVRIKPTYEIAHYTYKRTLKAQQKGGPPERDNEFHWIRNGRFSVVKTRKPVLVHYSHKNDPSITWDPQLLSSSDEIRVCADGSNTSLLRIKVDSYDPLKMDYKFRIKASAGKDVGSFSEPRLVDDQTVEIRYTHPDKIDGENKSVTYDLELYFERLSSALNKVIQIPVLTKKLIVYRPPVLMVHGLWSDETAFDEMTKNLATKLFSGDRSFLFTHDYRSTNNSSFAVNYPAVGQKVAAVTANMQSRGIACGKVDYVAHSMGGILGRLYLQSEDFKDDIHKLITVNTPHSGSQIANKMLRTIMKGFIPLACLPHMKKFTKGALCSGGAIADLAVNSDAILKLLNGTNRNRNTVPSHTIITDHQEFTDITDLSQLKKAPNGFWTRLLETPKLLFDSDSDLIVSITSQSGGLQGLNSTLINKVEHMGSPAHPQVIEKVSYLLHADSKGLDFAQKGFKPYTITAPIFPGNRLTHAQAAESGIKIISPSAGASFETGREIDIMIEGNGISKIATIVEYGADSIFAAENDGMRTAHKFMSEAGYTGRKTIIALGLSATGEVVADTSYFFVTNSPLPVGMLYVSAARTEAQVRVSWATSWERNSYCFEVERSPDGKNFSVIGKVWAQTNSRVLNGYEFTDATPFYTAAYYRITSRDTDGSFSKSRIVQVSASDEVYIFPNPATDFLHIAAPVDVHEIVIRDSRGTIVLRSKPASAEKSISIKSLTSGVYRADFVGKHHAVLHRQNFVVR